jgi:hypothetical protein
METGQIAEPNFITSVTARYKNATFYVTHIIDKMAEQDVARPFAKILIKHRNEHCYKHKTIHSCNVFEIAECLPTVPSIACRFPQTFRFSLLTVLFNVSA